MSRLVKIILFLSLFFAPGYVKASSHPEILDFIQLLTKADEPTLQEYARFSGEGDPGEFELFFELKECNAKNWANTSKSCVAFIRKRWRTADQQSALFLGWLRSQFSTVGKSYSILGVESRTEGFRHDLIEVIIGENSFLIFHNTDPRKPTGLVVGVLEVNGKKIKDYFMEGKKGTDLFFKY